MRRMGGVDGVLAQAVNGSVLLTVSPDAAAMGTVQTEGGARSGCMALATSAAARHAAGFSRQGTQPIWWCLSGQCCPHGVDLGLVVGFAKDGAARYEGVGTSVGHGADVAGFDTAIDLEADVFAAGFNALASGFHLAQGAINKALPAKTGVHAHQQNQVDVFNHPIEHIQRHGRVEDQAGLAAGRFDGLDAAVHMGAGIGVKADQVGPGLGKGLGQRIDGLHHQVHVNWYGLAAGGDGMGFERLADHGAEGQIGHIVVVHHVKVNPVGTGGNHVAHLLAQAGKVGGQNGWGNAVGGGGGGGGIHAAHGAQLSQAWADASFTLAPYALFLRPPRPAGGT